MYCFAEKFWFQSFSIRRNHRQKEDWNDIADNLCQLQQPTFRVNQKSVRDHYNKLVMGYKRKMRDELNASGISPQEREIDELLEEIAEKEMALEAEKGNIDNENNRRLQAKKVAADDRRRKAMETQAQTQKRKAAESNKTPKKKTKQWERNNCLLARKD